MGGEGEGEGIKACSVPGSSICRQKINEDAGVLKLDMYMCASPHVMWVSTAPQCR